MSLDLTKAPWPEWEELAKEARKTFACPSDEVHEEAYAFARHRVNLHEELVRELEEFLKWEEKDQGKSRYTPQECRILLRDLRQRLARAKQ